MVKIEVKLDNFLKKSYESELKHEWPTAKSSQTKSSQSSLVSKVNLPM
jgi:hypothetical protein